MIPRPIFLLPRLASLTCGRGQPLASITLSRKRTLSETACLNPSQSRSLRSGTTNRAVLSDPRLQDPRPASAGAAEAADQGHAGENALDTVDWERPGRLRVDYVLPSRDWRVIDAGVYWPALDQAGHAEASKASRHRLVWVDLALD